MISSSKYIFVHYFGTKLKSFYGIELEMVWITVLSFHFLKTLLTSHFGSGKKAFFFFFFKPVEAVRSYGEDILLGPDEGTWQKGGDILVIYWGQQIFLAGEDTFWKGIASFLGLVSELKT